ncbi:MAG: GNAT family N-acetyltransferase [Euryarchaeota archaeon]|nr:GNAT family N-acetyltransferase [Euryarchaeota archaeon]MDE1835497.1 GNAT family N-acetyltransferase [Euryarchaeota archaeon]MDE1880390.1 GNAT family N-acetyltransferase [Euryarchaeota archaeon]MDE2045778.1 GNAT family N-acetyltransferase [Thermoplasmata archaeon]
MTSRHRRVRIREATPADLPWMAPLFEALMNRSRAWFGLPTFSREKSRRAARNYIGGQLRRFRGPRGFALVAELGARPVGFVTVELHRSPADDQVRAYTSGEVQELHVQRGFRRQGVGTALMAAVERRVRSCRGTLVSLYTHPRLRAAHRFYGQQGYQVVSVKFDKRLP